MKKRIPNRTMEESTNKTKLTNIFDTNGNRLQIPLHRIFFPGLAYNIQPCLKLNFLSIKHKQAQQAQQEKQETQTSYAGGNFAGAKHISSAQYFGEDQAPAAERDSRLQKFEGNILLFLSSDSLVRVCLD